jgi:hypothetical protein
MGTATDTLLTVVRMEGVESYLRDQGRLADGAGRVSRAERDMVEGMNQVGNAFLAGGTGAIAMGTALVRVASNFEIMRTRMEVAMGGVEEGARTWRWAVQYAAQTPFDVKEVIDATTLLQLYGLEAQHWLPMVGDMAAAMSTSVLDATMAVARGMQGNLQRLRETFGLSTTALEKYGANITRQGAVLRATTEDQEALNTALQWLSDKFAGGIEKRAQTLEGRLNNLTDALELAAVSVGESLLPEVKGAVDWTTRWIDAFNELDPLWKTMIADTLKFSAGIGIFVGAALKVSAFGMQVRLTQAAMTQAAMTQATLNMATHAGAVATSEATAAQGALTAARLHGNYVLIGSNALWLEGIAGSEALSAAYLREAEAAGVAAGANAGLARSRGAAAVSAGARGGAGVAREATISEAMFGRGVVQVVAAMMPFVPYIVAAVAGVAIPYYASGVGPAQEQANKARKDYRKMLADAGSNEQVDQWYDPVTGRMKRFEYEQPPTTEREFLKYFREQRNIAPEVVDKQWRETMGNEPPSLHGGRTAWQMFQDAMFGNASEELKAAQRRVTETTALAEAAADTEQVVKQLQAEYAFLEMANAPMAERARVEAELADALTEQANAALAAGDVTGYWTASTEKARLAMDDFAASAVDAVGTWGDYISYLEAAGASEKNIARAREQQIQALEGAMREALEAGDIQTYYAAATQREELRDEVDGVGARKELGQLRDPSLEQLVNRRFGTRYQQIPQGRAADYWQRMLGGKQDGGVGGRGVLSPEQFARFVVQNNIEVRPEVRVFVQQGDGSYQERRPTRTEIARERQQYYEAHA